MEKPNCPPDKIKTHENLSLTNRTLLKLDGINEIISSSETQTQIKLKDCIMSISGNNLHITKLDIDSGNAEISGNFTCIKYGNSGNIFKRIFK